MPSLQLESGSGFLLSETGGLIELDEPDYLQTWSQVLSTAQTQPIYVTHRGGGAELAKDGAISSVQWVKNTGMARGNMILDGGDGRVTSDNVLVVSHDDLTGTLFDQNLSVVGSTAAQVAALNFRDFPLYRGTISTEKMPTMRQYLEACKALGIFALPEIKTDNGNNLVRDIVVELGMQSQTQVQAFASTAAQAQTRLGPSKTAGISVGLLQNTGGSNIGFPAISTCINGGPPDVVLYDPAADPGDAWISSAIAAGITLQVGTIERQHIRDAELARILRLRGRRVIFVSDDPFYLAGKIMKSKQSNFSTYVQHGLTESTASAQVKVDTTRQALIFDDAATQFTLLGEFCAPSAEEHWVSLEYTVHFDALDTATQTAGASRWQAAFFGVPDDRSLHDGTENATGSVSCHIRFSGIMDIYNRSSTTVSTHVATNNPATSLPNDSQSDNAPVAIAAGQSVRVRIDILRSASGALLNQVRFTRLDTGQWVQTGPGDAPLRGGSVHIGRNGTSGFKTAVSNIVATYRN